MTTSDVDFTGARDEHEARFQLLVDLRALATTADAPPSLADVVTRPSVLRRLARRLALHVPAGTDRLLVHSMEELPVGAAVGLATGLPYAAVLPGGGTYGEAHPSEVVALLAFRAADLTGLASAAESAHMTPTVRLAVFGPPDGDRTDDAARDDDVVVLLDDLGTEDEP